MEITLSKAVLITIVLAPLFGSAVAGLFARQLGRKGAQYLTIAGVTLSCVLSVQILSKLLWGNAQPFNQNIYTFFEVGNYSAHIGFMIDKLTAMMMVVVTFVSLLVHIYSIGYMADDSGYQRFFSYISLFTFSMLTLVMSNNFLQLFFGWEAVGLVSYLLIGFYFKRPSAVFANMKAFLVNRVGDFGFLLGIAAVFWIFGTLDYATVFANAWILAQPYAQFQILPEALNPFAEPILWSAATVICVCLFIGAMGKSAQVPLHVWLPDSMEGPTPISALIHAATMVTAGIFMVTRMSPLFELSPTALNFVLFCGATTAFFTGLIGIVQTDIKRVVAYSTLSQLGYMTVALGVSAYSAAVFHLMTHAFFKALLFLGAGSVIIGMHHEQNMMKMGGLRKYMPITHITMWIGTLALVGTPFLSGFYSKDSIIEAAKIHAHTSSGWIATYGYIAVLAGVIVTSFYSFRLLFLTFFGEERFAANHHGDDEHDHHSHDAHHGHGAHKPHESPWVVTAPLILLAIPSLFIGFITAGPMLFGTNWQGHAIEAAIPGQAMQFFTGIVDFYDPARDTVAELGTHWHGSIKFALHGLMAPAFWLTVIGFALAWVFYIGKPELAGQMRNTLSPLVKVLENKYGFDSLWIGGFAGGGLKIGHAARAIDSGLVDGVAVNGSARVVELVAALLRRTQSGFLYHYAFAMIIGVIVLLGVVTYLWG